MKTCNQCKIEQPKENFSVVKKKYLYYICKSCQTEYNRKQYLQRKPKDITTESKKCTACNKTKRSGLFYANGTSSDGLSSSCRSCMKIYRKKYYTQRYSTLKARLERSEKNRMKIKETDILREIQTLSRGDVRLFRNNVGFDLSNKVKYGLAPGSADLIGWRTITITEHHVGRKVAVFAAIEVKTPTGRIREDQQNFIDFVDECGGISGICRSVQDAIDLLNMSE